MVKGRCSDCNGTASVFSHERALSAYHRGLAALAKSSEPGSEQTPPTTATPRLTDDQFFARHTLDLAAYAVFTNSASTSIQKNEAFQKIVRRAYKPRGFILPVLIYRYRTGESFEITDVVRRGETFHVELCKKADHNWTGTLIVPTTESDVATWNKGREITSRDWVYTGYPSTLNRRSGGFYRSLAEFRRLHPGAEDTESP